MLDGLDLFVALISFAAGLPAATLAFLLFRKTKDRTFELLATGLGLLAALAFLESIGLLALVSSFVTNPNLRFVLWNSTFLLSFASLVVLRRFVALTIPGPAAQRTFPRLFSLVSAAVYGVILVMAFGWTPPVIDFHGRIVYVLSALYYALGFVRPAWRLWKAREGVASWLHNLLVRGRWLVGVPAIFLLLYEGARWASGASWPSLGPLVTLPAFTVVAGELFRTLAGSDSRSEPAEGDSADRAARIAARCVASPLTKREHEVLVLLLEGWRNQDIATRLGLSPSTVKNHVYAVYQKTGVANRVELVGLT